MLRYHGLSGVPRGAFKSAVVTWGVFDGVHRGHQQILRETLARAREIGGEAIVVTFDRHPRTVLTGVSTPLITSLSHRLALLERLELDAAVVLPFDRDFAALRAEEFVRRVLVECLSARGVVAGYNTSFGRNREGNRTVLESLGARSGFSVYGASPVHHRGQPISSTRIREAIFGGRLTDAAELLGRPVSVRARVLRGAGRGRTFGFPTANLDIAGVVCPPTGVYAALGRVGGVEFPALVNVGRRPTFEGPDAVETVEAHLVGYSGDLYDAEIEVEFHRKIRDERPFSSAQELARQIARDRDALLAASGAICLTGLSEGRYNSTPTEGAGSSAGRALV